MALLLCDLPLHAALLSVAVISFASCSAIVSLRFLPVCFIFRSACSAISLFFTGVLASISYDSFFPRNTSLSRCCNGNGRTDSGVIPDNSDAMFPVTAGPLAPGMSECFGDVGGGKLSKIWVDVSHCVSLELHLQLVVNLQ